MTRVRIRPAEPQDIAALEEIELAADRLLVERFRAQDWPPPATAAERAAHDGYVLVAEVVDSRRAAHPARSALTVVGFVHVLQIDGDGHLEQLSVHPDHGRRGIGRQLVHAALDESVRRGNQRITLRTYAEVPWNAPFYATCGFAVSTPDTPFLESLVSIEHALGLDAYGTRVQMTRRH